MYLSMPLGTVPGYLYVVIALDYYTMYAVQQEAGLGFPKEGKK